ncbi:MAG: PilT/PilU family type 4a pilus ATPase [Lachnospiraceae bacterium]|nr:PilT/PilU family type 4a pilus ATPase [Lachnospiraceae bacterium]
MNIKEVLQHIAQINAADLFIIAGRPLSYRKNEKLVCEDDKNLTPDDTRQMIDDIYELADHRSMYTLKETGDDDFSFAIPGISRFRVNTYKQRGSFAAVIRVIAFTLPSPEEMHIPQNIIQMGNLNKGLVLVTGPAGSGKSTTLACIIDYINSHRAKHIITLEDPLEYLHRHKQSIVSQREITTDTESYVSALRAALRQSPDVILLGEMRDYETIQVAITAAETGHLIFSTLHTIGAANTIDRIIDVFPANQQAQIAVQLSMTLQAVISQQFVPDVNGDLLPAFEIMTMTPALRNMIRDNKIPQIEGALYSASANMAGGMLSMDNCLMDYCKRGLITREAALSCATNPDMLSKRI